MSDLVRNDLGQKTYLRTSNNGHLKIDIEDATISGTGLATEPKQDTMITDLGAIKTSVQLLDNAVSGSGLVVKGNDGNDGSGTDRTLRTDGNGALIVDVSSDSVATSNGLTSEQRVQVCGTNDGTNLRTMRTDDDGHLQVDVLSGGFSATGLATEAKQDVIEATLTAIETDAAALETLQTSTNSKLDTIDGVLDDILTKNTEIDNAVDAMSAKLPASLGQKANASSLSICRSSTAGAFDVSARTTIGTASTSTKLLCDSDGHLQVDVLGGAFSSSGLATEAKQDVLEATLTAIETDAAALEVLQTSTNSKLDTIDSVLDNILVKQTAIATDLAAIEVINTTISNSVLLQQSNIALHQTGTTNTTITIGNGANSNSKEVSLSDIRAAIVEPSAIAYHITSTGTGASGTDIQMEVSLDGSTFITLDTNIQGSSKGSFTGNLGDDNLGLALVGSKFKFKITNNSGGSANYTINLFAYGMDFSQAN